MVERTNQARERQRQPPEPAPEPVAETTPVELLLVAQQAVGNRTLARLIASEAARPGGQIAAPASRALLARLQRQPTNRPRPAPATRADQTEHVRATIAFLQGAADFYRAGAVVDAGRLPRILDGWLAALLGGLHLLRDALGNDAALTDELRRAYTQAVTALMAQAARRTGQTEDQLYTAHFARIHEWAWPATTAAAVAATPAAAAARLRQRWGVTRVVEGTLADQAAALDRFRVGYFGSPAPRTDIQALLQAANWQAWSPASGSDLYVWLVEAFEQTEQTYGGVPAVQEIIFFQTDYTFLPPTAGGPALRPKPGTAADFGGGHMTIYQTGANAGVNPRLPSARSTPSGPAAMATPDRRAGFTFNIIHELGHGVVETVLGGPDPQMMAAYGAHVGWHGGRLYDGGVPAVQAAIAADHTPPVQHLITDRTWNDGRWVEQPISAYMATGLSEDFPEAIAAFAAQPALLRARSPRRHDFIAGRLSQFRPLLRRRLGQVATGSATP